ncbi:hypothetical protein KSP39_PZI013988 [Platanthera zijinensis]|uniref:Uncharacterized protein n=1 Tax=Platanthera zijinensis TaxID=2320716 RepID=A0AAP0BC46_9ASPA
MPRILGLRWGGKTARVADESSATDVVHEFERRETPAGWHGVPVSVLIAVLRAPLNAASCLCHAGGEVMGAELPLSADEINHLMAHDCRRYAIYV